jgi:hypothetical protein
MTASRTHRPELDLRSPFIRARPRSRARIPASAGSPHRLRARAKAYALLAHHFARDRRIKTVAIDGWTALNAYVPPQERRGIIVVDPPFEEAQDFTRLALGLETAYRKWTSGIYLLWYPIKGGRNLMCSRAGSSAVALPASCEQSSRSMPRRARPARRLRFDHCQSAMDARKRARHDPPRAC